MTKNQNENTNNNNLICIKEENFKMYIYESWQRIKIENTNNKYFI